MFGTNHNKVKPFSPSSRQKTVAPADEISGRSFLIRAASFVNNNNPIQPSPPEDKKEEIDFSLDYLGRFRDPKLQEEFIIACLEHRSTFSFLILSLSLLVWLLIENFLSPFQLSSSKVQGSVEIAVIVICVVAIILSITIYVCSITSLTKNHLIHTYVQLFFGISINVLFIMKIVEVIGEGGNSCLPSVDHLIEHLQIHVKPYIATSEINNVYDAISKELLCLQCTQHSSDFFTINSLAQVIMLSLCPQLLMAILHEPRLYLTFTSHFLTGGLLIFTISVQGNLIIPLAFMIIAIAVVLYEIHIQRTQYFLNNRKLQDILNKNEKNALEIHAMEMRSMIGNVAHDLKTPLASFTNGLDIIKEILFSASVKAQAKGQIGNDIFNDLFLPIQTCLMSMRNTNAFMLMTINRCIDYTKASKGMKLVPKYETVDLREALQFPIECMSNIQERIGIKLEAMSGEICSHIITDKQWLQENLLCLLSNAVKYSTEGSVTIKVFKQCQLPKTMDFRMSRRFDPCAEGTLEHYLLFEIEDTGIGLSEEAMKHLFNPFKQAQRLAGGTGLGLYSLAKRVEALNGNYGVRKRTDRRQGSLFWFAIPYKADTAASAAAEGVTIKSMAREAVVEYKADAPADNLKILIVDDAPSILKMSSMMLKRQGHQIWTAENGEIALKRIEEKWRGSGKGFDLVLMDLQMPVMDGLEATRRLRAMEAEGRDSSFEVSLTSHLLIFGVSANSDHDTMKAAFDAGVDDFIGKPFSIDALNKCLQKFNS